VSTTGVRGYDPGALNSPPPIDEGDPVKKLLILLILVAIGIAVARRVRET
jgi:hypothetical protein